MMSRIAERVKETRDATLLLHVIDASDPHHEDRLRQVETVLEEIGAALAGKAYAGTVGPGQCVRVTTGVQLA